MQRVLQFDMKHWTKSCKSSCELELQTRYFCSFNQEYRDSIDSDISDNPLSVLDFSELVDWIPRHDKGLEIMRKENEYGRDTPLKDLHTSLVENFTFRFIQLNKIDEHKQDEIKEYLKMCASNEETSSEVKLDLINEMIPQINAAQASRLRKGPPKRMNAPNTINDAPLQEDISLKRAFIQSNID